jgi:hypothetical protein
VPSLRAALGGSGSTGWDWVIKAFQLARKHCPNSKLLVNEWGILNSSTNAGDTSNRLYGYIQLINKVKAVKGDDGRPIIDGVGCQGHGFETFSSSHLKTNLDRLKRETGLPVYITEYEANIQNDNEQLSKYRDHMPLFLGKGRGNYIVGICSGTDVERQAERLAGLVQWHGARRDEVAQGQLQQEDRKRVRNRRHRWSRHAGYTDRSFSAVHHGGLASATLHQRHRLPVLGCHLRPAHGFVPVQREPRPAQFVRQGLLDRQMHEIRKHGEIPLRDRVSLTL